MTLYARCEGNTVVERREMDPPPAHKAHLWRPVVIEGTGPIEVTTVEAERVLVSRSAQPVTDVDVQRERERRLALGFNYPFGDARGAHHIGTTKADLEGWREVSDYAGALIDSGDTETKINIVTDTGPCQITAPEWSAIKIAAAAFRQPIWAKSFALMASNPIPADYTDDRHWT